MERVVGQVLDSHAAQLRTEIVRQVMEEIAAQPAAAKSTTDNATPASGLADLARAVAEIQLGSSQREILRALLDTTARYAARVALFVVKGSHATGWQARGFANSDGVKDFQLDGKAPAVTHAIGDRVVASAPVADMDSRFLRDFGKPANGDGRILPLILKDKVAALVYADAGTDAAGLLDAGSLELLVLSTSAWLEVSSLRKQAQANADSQSVASALPSQPPVQAAPAFNDPFASHAPGHAKAAAASASAPVASAATEAPALAEPLPIGRAHAETMPKAAPDATPEAPASSMSPEDQDVHRKAQRFARLLVDEVKLYNQAKVAEGRKNKDLYDRLKEAIEKSRATYQKRYGNTVAASGNYFQNEIVRSLAEDDLSIMGANFRQ
ncbi:MAG TPA: hypothetical protein VKH18_10060 [Terriglobales bacterium]|nr:hypothetical protein [Terriglobales bacterium]